MLMGEAAGLDASTKAIPGYRGRKMGPMGPMRLIELMSLMRPMRLMGPMGLIGPMRLFLWSRMPPL